MKTQPVRPEKVHAASLPTEPAPVVVAIDPPPKKKIVFTQFDVADVTQMNDINDIYDSLPAALSRRIGSGNRFRSSASHYSIPKADDATRQQAIMEIAAETGAQFVISGTVIDAGIVGETRHIEVELHIHDGFTGAPLLSLRLEDRADGDVRVGNNIPFGSRAFYDTAFGGAVNRLIDSAAKSIGAALADLPFAAHITRYDGRDVLLDAGSESLLKRGYQLVAYVNATGLGSAKRPADVITLVDVMPQFSVGLLSYDAAALGIEAGDVAAINDADRRYLAAHPVDIAKIVKARQQAQAKWLKEKQIAKENQIAEKKQIADATAPEDAKAETPGAETETLKAEAKTLKVKGKKHKAKHKAKPKSPKPGEKEKTPAPNSGKSAPDKSPLGKPVTDKPAPGQPGPDKQTAAKPTAGNPAAAKPDAARAN